MKYKIQITNYYNTIQIIIYNMYNINIKYIYIYKIKYYIYNMI